MEDVNLQRWTRLSPLRLPQHVETLNSLHSSSVFLELSRNHYQMQSAITIIHSRHIDVSLLVFSMLTLQLWKSWFYLPNSKKCTAQDLICASAALTHLTVSPSLISVLSLPALCIAEVLDFSLLPPPASSLTSPSSGRKRRTQSKRVATLGHHESSRGGSADLASDSTFSCPLNPAPVPPSLHCLARKTLRFSLGDEYHIVQSHGLTSQREKGLQFPVKCRFWVTCRGFYCVVHSSKVQEKIIALRFSSHF